MRLLSLTHAAYALLASSLLVACCAGALGLGAVSQLTPTTLAASLQDCPAAAAVDLRHDYHISSCGFLPPNSNVTLQPGPPAALPLHTTLIGAPATGPLQATCCGPSHSTVASPLPPQPANATTTSNTTASLPTLDLSRLAPSSLVVPPNGTLSLHSLTLTAAQLPTAPYPLPAGFFLSLLAIRLSPGSRLQLSSVTITTTSCVSLALHQDLACRSSPSPTFTVTPTSLLVHSYTTASLAAQDVLLTCSGRQLPAPCTAVITHSGEEIMDSVRAWEQAPAESTPVVTPLYLWIQGTVRLSRPPMSDNAEPITGGRSSPTADAFVTLPDRSVQHITRGTLVLAGPPDRSSVLDLSGSSSLWGVRGTGAVRLQHLTLRGLPLGPPERYPEALLRLPMWFAPALRSWLGRTGDPLLALSNVTVELPPEEMAFWRDARNADLEPLVEQVSPEGSDGDSVDACITDSGTLFFVQELAAVPECSSCLLAQRLTNVGGSLDIRDTLLVDAADTAARPQPSLQPLPPLPLLPLQQLQQLQQQQQQQDSSGALGNQQDRQTRVEHQQLPGLYGGLRLPPVPSTPLCALAPGPGAQDAELVYELITKAYRNAWWGRPMGPSPPSSPSQRTPAPSSWRQGQLLPPLLRNLSPDGLWGSLFLTGLTGTLKSGGVVKYSTVLLRDAQLDTRYDVSSCLRNQPFVQVPGTMLLGDPVGIRTLDLAGRPSAVVLEREPLHGALCTWDRQDLLLPLLDTVRQQRQAAGLRGLLTEPVSLTIRHLVLINLPAAGPFVRILPPPSPPRTPAWEPPGKELKRLLLTESKGRDGVTVARVAAGRGLQQVPQLAGEGTDAAGGAGAAAGGAGAAAGGAGAAAGGAGTATGGASAAAGGASAAARGAGAAAGGAGTAGAATGGAGAAAGGAGAAAGGAGAAADADYLGGLPPSLANLTSCVWSLQLDRAAVVRAVRDRLQQGGTHGGGGAGDSSSSSVQSPVDVSYVLLQSVQLVVPERELLLLAWAWATNATRHAAHPGLAEQLQLMLDGSKLANGAGALQQRAPQNQPGSIGSSAPALPSGLRLVFDQFVWCGLLGTNVTLTSQLPAPTELSLQLPDLDLPVAYGTSFDVEPQRGNSGPKAPPPWERVPLAASPPPTGPMDGKGASAAVGGGGQKGASWADGGTGDAAAPGRINGTMQPSAADAAAGGGGGGSSTSPLSLGAVVALAVSCTAVSVWAAAGAGVWLVRRRRGQARDRAHAKEQGCELFLAVRTGQPAARTMTEGHQQQQPHVLGRQPHVLGRQPHVLGRPLVPRGHRSSFLELRQHVLMRLGVERNRQLVLGQQQEQQQLSAELAKLGTQRGSHCGKSSKGSSLPGAGHSRSVCQPGGATGRGSPVSLPSASPGMAHVGLARAGRSCVAKDRKGGSGLSLDLEAASSSGASTSEVAAAAEASNGLPAALAAASRRGAEGSCPRGQSGGGSRGGNNSNGSISSHPLVLLRELGRGAQGVVYAGWWRGLDVAVKSVLVQRLRGSPNGGGSWHGPSLHSALAEGSISSAMSHPHVVATYATYVQGPEGEEQVVVGEQEEEQTRGMAPGGGAAGGPSMPASGAVGATAPLCRSATAAPALKTMRSVGAAELQELHGVDEEGDGVAGAAIAMGSGSSCNVVGGPGAEEQMQRPELHPTRTTAQRTTTAHSEPTVPTPSGLRHSRSVQLSTRTPGAAGAQVQVWKLTLVQELCTGGSLRDSLLAGRLARRGGGPWPRALHPAAALRLALHVARGSAHLHRHGVLWNDLSSANVLLQLGRRGGGTGEAMGTHPSGGDSGGALDFVAKVADFGLSRRLPEGATHASETAGRSGLYVAPEVVQYGRCTPASDVYAYGVLLWEVAAGVPLPELLSQPEGGVVRSWLAQQAFVPPEEAEALPAELLAWPGAEQRTGGKGPTGDGAWGGTSVDGGSSMPAGYVALAEQCLRQDPRLRPSFEDVCLRLGCMTQEFGGSQ